MTTQRQRLEKEIQQLTRLLEAPFTPNRGQLVNELKHAAEQMQLLDQGKHWTQVRGETLGKIVSNEMRTANKKNGA